MAERKSRVEQILLYALGRETSLPSDLSRVEHLLLELVDAIQSGGGGGDTSALAARVSELESKMDTVQTEQTIQNELIDDKVDIAAIPSMTQEEYDALEEKTAMYYFIKEDEKEIAEISNAITPVSQGISYDGFTIPSKEVDSYANNGEEY